MSVAEAPCGRKIGVKDILGVRVLPPKDIEELRGLGFVQFAQRKAMRRVDRILGGEYAHMRSEAYALFGWELDSQKMKKWPKPMRADLRLRVHTWVDVQVMNVLKAMLGQKSFPDSIPDELLHYQRRRVGACD